MLAIQRSRCVASEHRARLLERSLRLVEAAALDGEVGDPPERAREPPAVACTPEDVAGLGEMPLGAA